MPPLSVCATPKKHHSPGGSFIWGGNTMEQLCLLWPGEAHSLPSTHVALVGHGPPECIQPEQTQPSLHLLETEQEASSICSLLQVLMMRMENKEPSQKGPKERDETAATILGPRSLSETTQKTVLTMFPYSISKFGVCCPETSINNAFLLATQLSLL